MDEPHEEERLPAGHSIEMEDSNLLVLRRADGSVVKRFVFFHEPFTSGTETSRRG